ncbi:MAG TPA: hypothetical protein VF870_00445 [Ignavibacteriaceae bacterium]
MQLIEIIQLALLIFIALGAVILFFSYIGYRSKSKVKDSSLSKEVEIIEDFPVTKVVEDPDKSTEKVITRKSIKQNPKFEIFKPADDDQTNLDMKKSNQHKLHSPKTLIIKHKS